MVEFRDEKFRKVLQYGHLKAQEVPPPARQHTLENHLRWWAISRMGKRGHNDGKYRPPVDMIVEGGEIVGVRVHV